MKRLRKNIFVAAAGLMLIMQIQTVRAQITPGALRLMLMVRHCRILCMTNTSSNNSDSVKSIFEMHLII